MMMMRPLGSLLLLTCGLLLSNQHANAVTELTDANFFDYAKDKDVLLVDFYAPWCSDCKALDPDFENAASNLGTRSVDLAKVDCFGAGKGLCSTYGVKQWPTLKNFNRGQYTGDYTGGLSTAEIAGYITTVENSVHPVVNPYAAPYTPQASAVVTQQCVAKCKISRISNKQPCYARCKPKSYGKKPILPQPVINEKSCAKCRQPAIAGKFRHFCSPVVEKQCNQLMASIWKKYEKPRSQPSIAPDLFQHHEKGMITAVISGIKPNSVVGAFVRVPIEKYIGDPNRGVPRVNNKISALNRLRALHLHRTLVRKPWDGVGDAVAMEHSTSLRPTFISNGQHGAAEGTALEVGTKETTTLVSPATESPKKSEKPATEHVPSSIAGTAVKGEKTHSNASLSSESKTEQPADAPENAQLKKNVHAELSAIAPTGDTSGVQPPKTTSSNINAEDRVKNEAGNLKQQGSDPIISESVAIHDTTKEGELEKNAKVEARDGGQLTSPLNASSVSESAAINEVHREADVRDGGQLQSLKNTSTLSEKSRVKNISVIEAEAKNGGQVNTPSNASLVSENAPPSNENAPINGNAPSNENAPSNGNAPSNENVPSNGNALSNENVPSNGNAPSNENAPSKENVPSNGNALSNDTTVTVVTDKSAVHNGAQEKSTNANETKSLKEMDALESEIKHGIPQVHVPSATELPSNATADTGSATESVDMGQTPAQIITLSANDQLSTINSIESQIRNGALMDGTSQLEVSQKRLDVLPPDVAVMLPYTSDDKKEKIPTRSKLEEAPGFRRTEK